MASLDKDLFLHLVEIYSCKLCDSGYVYAAFFFQGDIGSVGNMGLPGLPGIKVIASKSSY